MFLNQHLLRYIQTIPPIPIPEPVLIHVDYSITASCNPVVELTAQILSSLSGLTFYWEQISGSTVTWLQPQNQLTTQFEQPAVKDDKKFRLTINAGLPSEMVRDVVVTTMPKDYLKVGVLDNELYSDINKDHVHMVTMPVLLQPDNYIVNDSNKLLVITYLDIDRQLDSKVVNMYLVNHTELQLTFTLVSTKTLDIGRRSSYYLTGANKNGYYVIEPEAKAAIVSANTDSMNLSITDSDKFKAISFNQDPVVTSLTVTNAHQINIL